MEMEMEIVSIVLILASTFIMVFFGFGILKLNKTSKKEVIYLGKHSEIKSDDSAFVVGDTAFDVGEKYLIRTVTMYYTGELKKITSKELVLENAAWICDTGQFSECLEKGTFNEVEPYVNDVIVSRDAIVDATIWAHDLPRNKK